MDDRDDRDDKGPQALNKVLRAHDGILAMSRRYHEERVQRVQEDGIDLNSSAKLMLSQRNKATRSFPRLSELLPEELTVGEFLECTTEKETIEVEKRLERCSRCPDRGGMCSGIDRQGQQPTWGYDQRIRSPSVIWNVCKRWRMYSLDQRMVKHGFPSLLVPKTFRSFNPETEKQREALQNVMEWANRYEQFKVIGKGLCLMGEPGIGKTHLAVAAVRRLMAARIVTNPRFWDFVNLIDVIRAYDEESKVAVRDAMNCDLLVLDDLNVFRATDWVREQLGKIINHRWSNGLMIIVTSNDTLGEYAEVLGERTVTRIFNMVIRQGWDGPDYRMRKR